jgi:ribosomal protein L13E
MKFYSLVLRKKIEIPDSKVKTVTRKGRRFAVGKYEAKGKKYEAWRILGKASKK